jgi:hypothetical protein
VRVTLQKHGITHIAYVCKALAQVSDHIDHVSNVLHVQSELALSAQHIQAAAAHSAENLLNVIIQLTNITRLELESINDTAVAIRENLITGNQLSYWLSGVDLLNMINAVLKSKKGSFFFGEAEREHD